MKVIRSLSGGGHMLNDFFYAISEKTMPEEFSNSYCFKTGTFNNFGSDLFESFANEVRQESHIVDMGSTIINIGNLRYLEVMSTDSTFRFHFDNNSKFVLTAPDELKSPLKFSALSKILCNAISDAAKGLHNKTGIAGGEYSSLLHLPNFIKN